MSPEEGLSNWRLVATFPLCCLYHVIVTFKTPWWQWYPPEEIRRPCLALAKAGRRLGPPWVWSYRPLWPTPQNCRCSFDSPMLQHLFAWRRGLLSASPARPLFLVFRDCCLTPPQKFRCSFQHGIWACGTAAAAVCLALPLAVCIASTGFFFSLPRLLLDPPQKFRCSFPTNCSSGVAAFLVSVSNLASGPVASSLPSPLARPLFLVFRDCRLTPLKSLAAASQPTGWRLGLWHPAWCELVGLLLFVVFWDCCLTSLKILLQLPAWHLGLWHGCCLTPPQKFRCSFQHGIWACGTAAAAVCLALPLAVCCLLGQSAAALMRFPSQAKKKGSAAPGR